MKLFKKMAVVTGMTLLLSSSSLLASPSIYFVKKGDTLSRIVNKLGFSSIKESGIKVQSGNNNIIYVGEGLIYHAKHKKKKKHAFKLRKNIDLAKFCFKDNHSIHYRSEERCIIKADKKHSVKRKKKHNH
jgi:LysM repeat protein